MIAGRRCDGHAGPGSTHTPITLLHASIAAGRAAVAALAAELQRAGLRARRLRHGGPKAEPIPAGQLVVFGAGDRLTSPPTRGRTAAPARWRCILLGGEPIQEPMVQYGPFVMNTREELEQALEDYQSGRLGRDPAGRDHAARPARPLTRSALAAARPEPARRKRRRRQRLTCAENRPEPRAGRPVGPSPHDVLVAAADEVPPHHDRLFERSAAE